MCDEASCRAAVANLSISEMLHIKMSVPESTERVKIQDCIACFLLTVFCAKPESKSAQEKRLQAFRVGLAVAASLP